MARADDEPSLRKSASPVREMTQCSRYLGAHSHQ